MKLFESERKVMDVLWRDGAITAGEISKILALEIGWNRNTTYTIINKCIAKGYISRGEKKFICTVGTLSKTAAENNITKTALMIIGDAVKAAHYDRSKLYDPSFTTEFRKATK